MSTEFLDGRRFVFARTIEITQTENTNDVMEGQARTEDDTTVPVTLTRDEIEKGRAIFLMTREGFDDEEVFLDSEIDPDAMEHEVFGEPEPDADIWLVPVEGSDPVGYRYNIDRVNKILTYETAEGLKTLEGEELYAMQTAVRVDETGRMICQFSKPLEMQEKLCQDAGAADHLAEIELDFELMKRDPNGYVQARAYSHDVTKLAPDETYTDDAILAKRDANAETLVVRSQIDDRTDAQWDILLNNGMFRNPQVRGIFNYFMGSRLKDFPIDQVGVTRFATLEESIAILTDAFPEHKEVAPFDGGTMMPGYRTSPVHEFTDGKITVITFSDLPGMQAYAYAYPNELTLDADVTPDSPAPAF
jgi:hypothetical protein